MCHPSIRDVPKGGLRVKRLDGDESIRKVPSDLGLGEVIVEDRRRNRSEIEKWVSQQSSNKEESTKSMKKVNMRKIQRHYD